MHRGWRRIGLLLASALLALALVGCGEDSPATLGPLLTVSTTVAGSAAGYGSAGNAKNSDRTIVVSIVVPLDYQPSSIQVQPGETVVFAVSNDTPGLHEFVIGNTTVQDAYESHMVSMGSTATEMPDEANVLDLEPGQTKQLAWTFPAGAGSVIFGSHQPGDYANGLKGTITVGVAPPTTLTPTTLFDPMNHQM